MLLLILFSLALAAGFLLVYLWAARNGQFDDDYTPSVRILFDEPLSSASEEIVESVSTPVESIQSK